MKKYFIFLAAAAVIFATSCNKEEINTPVPTEFISVELNPMTKTQLNGLETVWVGGDEVDVFVGTEKVGTLKLKEDSANRFEGDITAGKSGNAVLKYPARVSAVPAEQQAVANSFANKSALLEGETTIEDLRAGNGATLSNVTALLKFTVAQDGDVTFEVGANKYTVKGCKTGSEYYACVAPASNVALVARIGGYLSKQASKNVTFAANKISNLGALPAPEKASWGIRGSFSGASWSSDLAMYKDINNSQVLKNADFGNGAEFKFYNTTNGWSGYVDGNDSGYGWKWISGNGGNNISASGKVDIYVNDSGWAFKIVAAGTSPF